MRLIHSRNSFNVLIGDNPNALLVGFQLNYPLNLPVNYGTLTPTKFFKGIAICQLHSWAANSAVKFEFAVLDETVNQNFFSKIVLSDGSGALVTLLSNNVSTFGNHVGFGHSFWSWDDPILAVHPWADTDIGKIRIARIFP